ncbi:type II toxin-antitoxin system Phd/YefM family antitoxin [Streptomyces californicus]|nr:MULTISPECIES: type II toxin-antitoxin system prevent-host-death family antitoxin [Streptomyces]MDW4912678.1 type II toxin-antitoxin system prevent-host-death family antitoxin [Streptomyces californicus]MYW79543.1 type II toxin-antitoxin system prevent-host-death family antitoxin [Streptomyces sp. SID8369]NEA11122.1 type II toxin-antitoxin system prevent-host-death family antitoxin [Streptomyces sp. SID10692]QRV56312.1 type II toxin-antitoxin system prevent-host-death family antitoxin [Strept
METTAHEFNRYPAQFLAAAARGETITVTENGAAVARLVPHDDDGVPPYPTDPMGTLSLPDLGLPDLPDQVIEDVVHRMGS